MDIKEVNKDYSHIVDIDYKMIREKILYAIEKKKTNKNKVSKACDINRSNLNRFLKGKPTISIAKLERIFKHLDIELKLKNDPADL